MRILQPVPSIPPPSAIVRIQYPNGLRDRGKARFDYVGREEIRDAFEDFSNEALEAKHGSTFLIQGPPGVGKTALWHQLASEARERGWYSAVIDSDALHSAPALAEAIGKTAATGETKEGGIRAEGGVSAWLGKLGISVGRRRARMYAGTSLRSLLQELGKKEKGALLILDEAQSVAALAEDPSTKQAAGMVLRQIHEGRCGGPVVLLATGLGHTKVAFHSLGIPRFPRGAVNNLGRLSDKAARELIEDYLAEGAKERVLITGQDAVVEEILARCHGWPQHLVAYGDAALKVLPVQRAGHVITAKQHQHIHSRGDRARMSYYRGRATGLVDRERALLGALVQSPRGLKRWSYSALTHLAEAEELGSHPVPDLLDHAVARGVLAEIGDDNEFHIPIPSMADWLVDRYSYYQSTDPARAAELAAAVAATFPPLARNVETEGPYRVNKQG